MKKLILLFIATIMLAFPAIADPGNRLGQSLSTVQSQVSGLRHLRNWHTQGDQYVVYHNIEASTSYYFRNGIVIKEVFSYSGNKNNAIYMFQRFTEDFETQDFINISKGNNSVTFYFSRIRVVVSIEHFSGNEYLCKVTYTFR